MAETTDIGLDVEAPQGSCEDENCPFHGTLSVRGRTFQGEVVSEDMEDTVRVRWGYSEKIPKYERYERRNTKVTAHNPSCIDAREGDSVTVAECRPISKTKSFVVVESEGSE
ncbi:MAG: 30S ribosomal protein S17 [Candidatus Nanohaloarchaeota archaeon QJJ-7]|nr:30S ribosomal protein S17 [Candidatus Nanohaloarchaeota archaeon QJJ-7]